MNNKIKIIFLSVFSAIIMVSASGPVSAQQGPMITIRFDDGLVGQYNYARPILKKYNFPATVYAFTDPLQEGNWVRYMKWDQIKELQDVYGWEIGSHTKSHADLTILSPTQLIGELGDSKAIFNNKGFAVKSFSSPFGYYTSNVLSYVARFYESHNSAWPCNLNSYPYSDYQISAQEVKGSTSLAQVKGLIDSAVSNKKWLVLLFHDIVELNPSEYQYSKKDFEAVVDYIKTKNVPVVNVSEALKTSGSNLISNSSFESLTGGWADGWTRTDTLYSVIDTNSNGSFIYPKNSLKLTGSDKKTNACTKDFIGIDPSKTYLLKSYFNCQEFQSGGVDVFIDEYDASGKWISWKWQTGIWSSYVGSRAVAYTPSQNAAKILIWIQNPASNSLTCYVDNVVLAEETK